MAQTLRVEGLRELLRVTDRLPKDVKRDVRRQLRQVAEPIRVEAQERFLSNISADSRKTNYGISVRQVGTITIEQRVRGTNREPQYRRPKFTDLVWERSLEPAAEHNEDEVRAAFNRVLDDLERRWKVAKR